MSSKLVVLKWPKKQIVLVGALWYWCEPTRTEHNVNMGKLEIIFFSEQNIFLLHHTWRSFHWLNSPIDLSRWCIFSEQQFFSYLHKKKLFKNLFQIVKNTAWISVFSPNTGKYGPEKTPYLDTFHAVKIITGFLERP